MDTREPPPDKGDAEEEREESHAFEIGQVILGVILWLVSMAHVVHVVRSGHGFDGVDAFAFLIVGLLTFLGLRALRCRMLS